MTSARKGASIWKSAGMAAALRDSGASWFSSWGPDSKGVSVSGVEFVPMIWGAGNATDATIATARARSSGSLLGFNEPDLAGQAQLSVEQALTLWPKLQATGLRLGAPAVAYGGNTPGGWLDRFMSGAAAKGYRVDFIPLHWYGGDFRAGPATDQLKTYVSAVYARYHKPVWITEYALLRFGPTTYPSAAELSAFVASSTAMLRGLSFVERYAWFSLATPDQGGDGTGLYRPDGSRTAAGNAYRAATWTGQTARMRIVCRGSFTLSSAPEIGWFTPEGERAWVDGWDPVYCSGATDEPGAVWTTHGDTTWVTTDRTPTRVRYARVAGNGTAGTVEVRCAPDGAGTEVTVTYDLTATEPRGETVLQHFESGFAAMLEQWRVGVSRAGG